VAEPVYDEPVALEDVNKCETYYFQWLLQYMLSSKEESDERRKQTFEYRLHPTQVDDHFLHFDEPDGDNEEQRHDGERDIGTPETEFDIVFRTYKEKIISFQKSRRRKIRKKVFRRILAIINQSIIPPIAFQSNVKKKLLLRAAILSIFTLGCDQEVHKTNNIYYN
jgi:hypothetical protein